MIQRLDLEFYMATVEDDNWNRIKEEREARGEHAYWTIERVAGIKKLSEMKSQIKKIAEEEHIDLGSDYFHKLCMLVRYRDTHPSEQELKKL